MEDRERQCSVYPRVCSVTLWWSAFSGRSHMGLSNHDVPVGVRIPMRHLRGAKWLQSLPLGKICLIEA